ncbi:hypothetical protein [Planomonospora sp. ID82291]|uniref:hypothetical protein n=1 Tax=Planomonospora sp. ID82291 TaxID=2738136 RepID=UPI0018C40FEA|nr:hypothetical protein [Planomonospora sp. ID82291]
MVLRQLASNTGYHLPLLSAVINVNNLQKRRAIQRLKDELGTLTGARVALLGTAVQAGDRRHAGGAEHGAGGPAAGRGAGCGAGIRWPVPLR